MFELGPGQQQATYRLTADSAEELGRQIDRFLMDVNLDEYEIESSFCVDFSLYAIRAMQRGVVRRSLGPFSTFVTIYRRNHS